MFCQSSHMSAKNSKKSAKKLPEFSCLNPDCPVGYRSFDTVKGYQNHLTHFPVCTEYNSRLLSLWQTSYPTNSTTSKRRSAWCKTPCITHPALWKCKGDPTRVSQSWIPQWDNSWLSRLPDLWWHWRWTQQWSNPTCKYQPIGWCNYQPTSQIPCPPGAHPGG